MSLFSKRCLYGLRAALYVVARQGDRPHVMIGEISRELGISFHFLTKILQQLTAAGLMQSFRGPKGGITLARPARSITLLEIVECLDGPLVFRSCVLGLSSCSDQDPCPLHRSWAERREEVRAVFAEASLAEVGRRALIDGIRLAD